jgi:hypothetical protein
MTLTSTATTILLPVTCNSTLTATNVTSDNNTKITTNATNISALQTSLGNYRLITNNSFTSLTNSGSYTSAASTFISTKTSGDFFNFSKATTAAIDTFVAFYLTASNTTSTNYTGLSLGKNATNRIQVCHYHDNSLRLFLNNNSSTRVGLMTLSPTATTILLLVTCNSTLTATNVTSDNNTKITTNATNISALQTSLGNYRLLTNNAFTDVTVSTINGNNLFADNRIVAINAPCLLTVNISLVTHLGTGIVFHAANNTSTYVNRLIAGSTGDLTTDHAMIASNITSDNNTKITANSTNISAIQTSLGNYRLLTNNSFTDLTLSAINGNNLSADPRMVSVNVPCLRQ